MKKNKKIILRLLLICLLSLSAIHQRAIARDSEQLQPGEEARLFNEVCPGNKEDMQSMRDLINILKNRINVKRVQVTLGNCYLVTGKVDDQRYLGVFEPYDLDELYYILKEPQY